MPAPRWRSCLPDWMPAGILISCLSPVEPGDLDRAAERGGGEADRTAREQGRALALEEVVPGEVDEDVEIAGRAAAHSGLALAGEADARALVDARRGCRPSAACASRPGPRPGRTGRDRRSSRRRRGRSGRSARPRRSPCARAPGRGRRTSCRLGAGAGLGARALAGLAGRGGVDGQLDRRPWKASSSADLEIVAQVRAAQHVAARGRPCCAPPMNSPKILSKMSAKEPKSCGPARRRRRRHSGRRHGRSGHRRRASADPSGNHRLR